MRKLAGILCLALLLAALGGCSLVEAEELYSLPQASVEYYNLQEALSEVLSEGWSYQAPLTGSSRESVQLVEIDGSDPREAVAFFSGDEGGRVCLFRQEEQSYTLWRSFSLSGSDIASVSYEDLTGDGCKELILTCRVGESVQQALLVFDPSAGEEPLLEQACARCLTIQFPGDAAEALCTLSAGDAGDTLARCYRFFGSDEPQEQTLALDPNAVTYFHAVRLEDEAALAVCSKDASGQAVTAILTGEDGSFSGQMPDELKGVSAGGMEPADADTDGITEFPAVRRLSAYDASGEAESVIDWYSLSSDGTCALHRSTYEAEDWELTLPAAWPDTLCIAAEAKEEDSCVRFYSDTAEKGGTELLTITVSAGGGEVTEGVTALYSDSSLLITCSLPDDAEEACGVTAATISEAFRMTSAQ